MQSLSIRVSGSFSDRSIIIPGTLRDSLYLLEGLLEQQTSLRPIEVMTDTHGYSDVVFGLFWLLGYQFSPRLADLGEMRLWRIDLDANYGVLDRLARNRLNLDLIIQNWDDLLRVAGSLKLGIVSASEIMRTLQGGQNPSTLSKAIGELGRIAKTLYLLAYIDDEAYRRRILTQLNRGESRHSGETFPLKVQTYQYVRTLSVFFARFSTAREDAQFEFRDWGAFLIKALLCLGSSLSGRFRSIATQRRPSTPLTPGNQSGLVSAQY